MKELSIAELKILLDSLWIDLNPDIFSYPIVAELICKINKELQLREQPYINYEVSNDRVATR